MTKSNNKPRIAFYTAIFGHYDSLKSQIAQQGDVDFICFTDQKITHRDWKVITVPSESNPRQQAKYYKLLPHRVAELAGYDFLIWIDGSFSLTRPDAVQWILAQIKQTGWAMFRHDRLNCVYEEAKEMSIVKKYQDMPVKEQAEFYRTQNYPVANGLYGCGLIARDMHNTVWQALCDAWWQENLIWTLRDQISLPYVLWKEQARLDVIEENIYRSSYFQIENNHRKHEYEPLEITDSL